ncbi:MAG: hypothetical protein ACREO3_11330 [Arenimonas sp.]
MHKGLVRRLWGEVDAAMARSFGARPVKAGSGWRVYRQVGDIPQVFACVRRHDVAGGGFVFTFGLSRAGFPRLEDDPLKAVPSAWSGDCLYVSAHALGLDTDQVNVDLDWQTPSAALVQAGASHPDAEALYATLGIHDPGKHHLLSHGILEALGVVIPDAEFEPMAARFSVRLQAFADIVLAPASERLAALEFAPEGESRPR